MPSDANDPAQRIRDALATVERLRTEQQEHPGLAQATLEVKRLQNRRFAGSYADLLQHADYEPAARFFLDELYSDRDYRERDAQFARIAGTLQTLFPQKVIRTAVSLAELHALTEALDADMAKCWIALGEAEPGLPPAQRYVKAWRQIGERQGRERQLQSVLRIGEELDRLTRAPGLRLMLKMMRGPAAKAGMGALQQFLEAGFDTFAAMARLRNGADGFLRTIESRESALLHLLFDAPSNEAGETLNRWLP